MSDYPVSDARLAAATQVAHERARRAAEARALFNKSAVGGDHRRAELLEAAAETAWREVRRLEALQRQQQQATRSKEDRP